MHPSFSWAVTSTSLDPCTFHHLSPSKNPFGPHPMLHCCRRTPCSRGSWWWICDPKKTGRVLQTWNWWPSSCTVALSMAGRGGRPCLRRYVANVLYSGAQWPKDCNTSSGETPLPPQGKIHFPIRNSIRNLNAVKLWQIMPIVRFTQFYYDIFWVNWYTDKLAEPRIFCTKWWFLYCRTSAVISGMGPTNLKSTPICRIHFVYRR